MNEREAYVALNMMEKVGPVGVRNLVALLGSAQAIFEAPSAALRQAAGVGRDTAEALLAQRERVAWQAEMERAEAQGVRLVTAVDEEYPAWLREIHDPPLALYVQGRLKPGDRHALAVVGTRHPTHYGREMAARLAQQLAGAGWTVVSGLAEGIDTAAHQGALRAKGRTLAVLGGGFGHLYPPSNAALARAVADSGAVISEFPFDRQPDKTTFPIRNRIVSGLSKGVVVVEAGLKSGAMITARQALEQGRAVLAVPGRADSFASQGCHALIRDGAVLVTNAEHVLSEFEALIPARSPGAAPADRPRPPLSDQEASLLEILEGGERDVDSLIRAAGLGAAAVNGLLISLEMKRMIRVLPGRLVERVGAAPACEELARG